MSADEVRRLGADEAIIFVEGARPMRAAKIIYYADARFTARLMPPVEVSAIEVPTHRPFSFDQPVSEAPATHKAPPARQRASRRHKPAVPATQHNFDRLLAPSSGTARRARTARVTSRTAT